MVRETGIEMYLVTHSKNFTTSQTEIVSLEIWVKIEFLNLIGIA